MDASYGLQYRDLHARHWWWRARERLILDTLKRLPLRSGSAALDVGCGDGLLFPALQRLGCFRDIRGIEVDESLLSPDGPHRDRISTAPLGDPVYGDASADVVTALDVIEHIEDDAAAVAEIFKMMAPGAHLVVTVPAFMSLWSHHDEINLHFRRYTAQQLEALLRPHGEIVDVRYLFHSLYIPKRLIAAVEHWGKSDSEDPATPGGPTATQHALPPRGVNLGMREFCYWESRLLRPVRLPFGTSVIGIVRS